MNDRQRKDLDGLITALLEGEISSAQSEALNQLLRTDWECRRHYLEAMDLHSGLLQSGGLSSGNVRAQPTRRKKFPRWFPATAAALLILTSILAFLAGGKRGTVTPSSAVVEKEETGAGCAVVSQVHGDTGLEAGQLLTPGPLHIGGGLVRIEFFSGATALLEGEAELNIVSAWAADLEKGRIRVSVPPPAEGFRINTPGMDLVDIGTEFAVLAGGPEGAEVHVFEGEVEAYPEGAGMHLVTEGNRFGKDGTQGEARPTDFISASLMDEMVHSRVRDRFEEWKQFVEVTRKDPRLISLYTFAQQNRWDRRIENLAAKDSRTGAGAAVGAKWAQGRWPGKGALEFKGAGDRVRVDFGGQHHQAITLACWVRVDGLDRKYNGLLLTDEYRDGEPHWQIYEDGSLMFSVAYSDNRDGRQNQIYHSPSVFNLSNQHDWHHIAVTYDCSGGEVVQYLDGREISREISDFHQPNRHLVLGPSEIGNWGLPTPRHEFPIRNLNGRIDEFAVYGAALTPSEISKLYQSGKPE